MAEIHYTFFGGGSGFVLEGTNYLSVLAQGTPQENGQAVRDAYAFAQTMTPNGGAIGINNRVVILLAPGYYSFDEDINGQFIIDKSFIDFESLSGHRDVYFSSIEVISGGFGIDIRLSGIDTTMNKYYTHAAFAVTSFSGPNENIIVKNCKGGNYSFSSFSPDFVGLYENCEAGNWSFGSTGDTIAPPNGITGNPNAFLGFLNFGGVFRNCIALSYSFCTTGINGASSNNFGTIENCRALSYSFCFSDSGYSENNGVIKNCDAVDFSFVVCKNDTFGNYVANVGSIFSCNAQYYSFVYISAPGYGVPESAMNFGTISNCTALGISFVLNQPQTIGQNQGYIYNCTAVEGDCFMGSLGENIGYISNCISGAGLCRNNPNGIIFDIVRCTLIYGTFTVGVTGGGRVVLGIDTTGVVNY